MVVYSFMEAEDRNYGIDLLRIISMMMVVILHINGRGGMLSAQYFTAGYMIALLMELAAIGAVNIYAMTSGYVNYGKRPKTENIIKLWVEAVFYGLVINLIFFVVYGTNIISFRNLLVSFVPITNETYWYLTAYVAVFLFIPVLNWCADTMSKNMATKVVMLGLCLSCWDLVSQKDIFKLKVGYNVVWLMFLYFIGAYIRKYYSGEKYKTLFRKYCGYIYVLTTFIVFIAVVILQKFAMDITEKVIGYTTPSVIIAAVALLLYFSSLEIKKNKIISFFAPSTFSVYLIHNHPLVGKYIMPQIFEKYINDSVPVTVLVFSVGTLSIFTFAVFIDKFRNILFSKLKIYVLYKRCSDRIVDFSDRVFSRIQ